MSLIYDGSDLTNDDWDWGLGLGAKMAATRILGPFIIFYISINLLAFYHQRRSLIGYATHYLFCDR